MLLGLKSIFADKGNSGKRFGEPLYYLKKFSFLQLCSSIKEEYEIRVNAANCSPAAITENSL